MKPTTTSWSIFSPVRPSRSGLLPDIGSLASFRYSRTRFSGIPSNTGVATFMPSFLQAQPRCVSRTCPTFMHEGTVFSNRDHRTLLDKMVLLLDSLELKEPF